MKFDDYQQKSKKTAIYPAIGHRVIYPTLGLVNEAGEVAGKIKKIFRDQKGKISDKNIEDLKGELGDVLWYVAQVCSELGLSMGEVAEYNMKKLTSRLDRDVLGGSGDNR